MLHKQQAKQKWLSWQWKQFDGLAALSQVNSFQVKSTGSHLPKLLSEVINKAFTLRSCQVIPVKTLP